MVKERSRRRSRLSNTWESEGLKQIGETENMLCDDERSGDGRLEEFIDTGEASSEEPVLLTTLGMRSRGDGSVSK